MENPMSDLYFLTIDASLWASEYSEYNGQQNAVQDMKVECNTVEYTMAFLCSDWLYCPSHGINFLILESNNFSLPDTVWNLF